MKKKMNIRNKINRQIILLIILLMDFYIYSFSYNIKQHYYFSVNLNEFKSDYNLDIVNLNNNKNELNKSSISNFKNELDIMIENEDKNNNKISDYLENLIISNYFINKNDFSLNIIILSNSILDINKIEHFFKQYNILIVIKPIDNNFNSIKFQNKIIFYYGVVLKTFNLTGKNILQILNIFIEKYSNILLIKEDIKSTLTIINALPIAQIYPTIQEEYGLKGDNYSAIAFIDSGIDSTHPMVDGYGDKDNSKKIIGWVDFTSENSSTPKDLSEHGTFCSAISAGNPYEILDSQNRTVISNILYRDWRGLNTTIYYLDTIISFNVSAPGTILAIGSWWVGNIYSGAEVKNITIIGPNGDYKINSTILNQNVSTIVEYYVSESELGIYKIGYIFKINQTLFKDYILSTVIHFPRNRTIETPNFRGIAPNSKLVMLRANSESEIVNAINWIILNGKNYNITTVNMSFKIPSVLVRQATEQLIENGYIVVAAAGNDYGDTGNTAGSFSNTPGSIDSVISVGAIDNNNHISSYSSAGGPTISGLTIKPDCVAPGGEFSSRYANFLPILSADANNIDFISSGNSIPDQYSNDFKSDVGTSYSCAYLSGTIQLILESLGGISNWNYTKDEVLWLKSLILMTSTEIAPNTRNLPGEYNPILNRGLKDPHEGYGRINPKALIDMLNNELILNSTIEGNIEAVTENLLYPNPAWARKLTLDSRYYYILNLSIPSNADFDVYIYKNGSTPQGDPILVFKGVNAVIGGNEYFQFSPSENGTYYIVVKAIIGQGSFNLTITSYLDEEPPYLTQLYLPTNNSYLNLNTQFSIMFIDNGTGVRKIRFNFIQLDNYNHNLIKTIVEPWEIQYQEIFYFDTRILQDGWYNLTLTAIDGNNNNLNSSSITICIDNTIPNLVKILNPKSGTRINKKILVEGIVEDELSGISKVIFNIDSRNPSKFCIIEQEFEIYQCFLFTNRSDDGLRYIWIDAYDRAGNHNSSLRVLVTINNRQIEFFYTILLIIFILVLFGIAYFIAKILLLKTNFENIFEFPKKILKSLQEEINKSHDKKDKHQGDNNLERII